MSQLQKLSQEMIPALVAEMRTVCKADGQPQGTFYGMIQYHMGWLDASFQPAEVHAGKRIRPLVTLLSCKASGGDWQQAIPAGASIELLHNFSLVHDDIEDVSPTRRGRTTMSQIWGQPQAINTGDAMFAIAHLAMGRLAERDVPAPTVVQAFKRFDETCLHLTMGQHMDMDFEIREEVQVDEYIEMITGKTAVLLSLCSELGALIAGRDAEVVEHYRLLGLNLGLAFQVIDDILGIWGDESRTGKSTATDIITKKKTLPVLYGLANNPTLVDLYREEEPDDKFVAEVIAGLEQAGARDFATIKAVEYSTQALQHLSAADPTGSAAEALQELTAMLLNRDY